MRKHGRDHFTLEVIDTASTLDELNTKEWFYAEMFNTYAPNGYNVKQCGDHTPPPRTCAAKVTSMSKRTKAYRLLSPTNEIIEGRNVMDLCQKHGLSSAHINQVIDGTRLSCQGWRNANRRYRIYHLVNSHTAVTLSIPESKGLQRRLADQLGLPAHRVSALLRTGKPIDGWTLQQITYVGEGPEATSKPRPRLSIAGAERRSSLMSRGKIYRLLDNRLGRVHEFTNIARFCREHGLAASKIGPLTRGECNRHQEWSLPSAPLRRVHLSHDKETVVLIDGDTKRFVRERNLVSTKHVFNLIAGRLPSYKGWKLLRVDAFDHTQCPLIDERLIA